MATATDQTLQVNPLSTSLTVDDIQKSIRFFEGLGFVKGETWDEGGKVVGAMLKAGDAELAVMQDDWKKGRDGRRASAFACSSKPRRTSIRLPRAPRRPASRSTRNRATRSGAVAPSK